MRKYIFLLLLSASLGLITASCTKDKVEPDPIGQEPGTDPGTNPGTGGTKIDTVKLATGSYDKRQWGLLMKTRQVQKLDSTQLKALGSAVIVDGDLTPYVGKKFANGTEILYSDETIVNLYKTNFVRYTKVDPNSTLWYGVPKVTSELPAIKDGSKYKIWVWLTWDKWSGFDTKGVRPGIVLVLTAANADGTPNLGDMKILAVWQEAK